MNKEINYSIIIPHKNIPKLLQRCLDSIPRRKDLQIIIVDDNSDPEKVDFDNFPGLNDPFVEVIFTKEGKGAGYARNVGLSKATGKWLLFTDADDFYNYCIDDILEEYVNFNADIVFFNVNSLDSDTYTTTYRCIHYKAYTDYWLYSPDKANILFRYKHSNVCFKLIKNELVQKNSISFDEVSIANDATFAYLAGYYADTIHVDVRSLYCMTVRKGSIRNSNMTFEKKIEVFYVIAKRYLFFKKHNIQFSFAYTFIILLIKMFFLNKINYIKARNILVELGFSSSEILCLCIFNCIVYIPNRILIKIFPERKFLPFIDSRFRKYLHNIKSFNI